MDLFNKIAEIKKLGEYRELGIREQMVVMKKFLSNEFSQISDFQQLGRREKDMVVNRYVSLAPTFENPLIEKHATELAERYYQEKVRKETDPIYTPENDAQWEMKNWITGDASVRSTGILPLLMKVTDPIAKALGRDELTTDYLLSEDNKKASEFLNSYMEMMGDSGRGAQNFGKLMGLAGDIASFQMAFPAVPTAGALPGSVVKMSGPQILGKALSENVKSPFMIKTLRSLVPIATEATVEGFLGTLRDDYLQERETGEGLFEKGPLEVMKHWGLWALEDFVVGSIATTLLATGGAYIKARKYHKASKEFRKMNKTIDELIDEIASGEFAPELKNQLPIRGQDLLDQRWGIKKLMDNGLSKANEMPVERMYYAASDTGIVVAMTPEGKFRYHYLRKGGDYATGELDNLSDVNDLIANRARTTLKEMPKNKRSTFLSAHPEIKARIDTLDSIDGYFDFTKHSDLPEELEKIVKQKSYPKAQKRIFVNKQEADFLSSKEVRKVRVDIDEKSLEKASLREHPLNEARGVSTTADEVNPNAVLVTRKTANPEQVQVARAKARRALMNEGSLDEEMLIREYLIGGGFDSYARSDGSLMYLFPKKVKFITEMDVKKALTLDSAEAIFRKGSRLSKRTFVESELKASFKANKIDDPKLFSKGIEFVADNPNNTNVGNLTRMYVKNLGDGYDVQVSKLPKNTKKKVVMSLNEKSKTVSIRYSDDIQSAQAKKAFFKEYSDELSKIAETKDFVKRVPFKMKAVKNSSSFSMGNTNSTLNWIDNIAKSRRLGSVSAAQNGQLKFVTKLADGTPSASYFDSVEDLKNFVIKKAYNYEDAKFDLAREGIAITRKTVKGDTSYKAILPNNTIIETSSLEELLTQVEFTPARLDINRFGPKVTAIDNGSMEIVYKEGTAVGPKSSILRMLENFEDKHYVRRLQEVFTDSNGKISISPDKSYHVYVPSVGNTFTFENLQSAKKFLKNEVDDFITTYDAGLKKGLRVSPKKLGYIVADGQKTYDASSLDEVKTVIRSYGDPEQAAPSLFKGLDDSIDTQVDDVILAFNRGQRPKVENYPYNHFPDVDAPTGEVDYSGGIFDQVSEKMATTSKWMEDYTRRINDPKLMQLFRGVDDSARRVAQIEINKTARNLKALFVNPKTKKVLSKQRRQAIFYHLGAQNPEEIAMAVERFGELDGVEREIAQNVKRVYEQLSVKFGINTQDLIHNYMPRIMRWSEENAQLINQMTNAEELFESFSASTGISANINFFAKNQRVSDILYFAHQNDAMEVLLQYSAKGHKNLYIEPAWQELQSYLMKNKNAIPPHIMNRLSYYKEMLTSSYKSDGMEFVEKMGEKFMKRLGEKIGDKKAFRKVFGDSTTAEMYGRDLFKTMFSLNYIASMGARPWLAIRNSFQPWTTLAPRFGNEYVMRAIKDVSDLGEDYYKYLNRIGVVGDKPPLANEILGDTTFLGGAAQKSLSWYTSSDEYTRAVAARTAESMLDDALVRWDRGIIKTEDQFRKTAQLSKIEKDVADQIMGYVRKGDDTSLATAKAVYMNKISNDTMFGYRKTETPQMFTSSIVGKLFGQYGTYSAGYRANLWRGLQNGSFAERAGFVTRFLGNHLALFGAFTALGINAKNFLPGAPAIFTGGPFFDLSLNTIKAMDFTTYEGTQARQELKRNLGYMIPGAMHAHYMKKAIDYAESGDIWKAWLSLTSTPTIND